MGTLKAFAQNQIWCAIVALAGNLPAWVGMLALAGHEARRWEPKHLRLRLSAIPTVLARTGRRTWLRLSDRVPWGPDGLSSLRSERSGRTRLPPARSLPRRLPERSPGYGTGAQPHDTGPLSYPHGAITPHTGAPMPKRPNSTVG